MAWQPQEGALGQLSSFLRDSISAYDRSKQKTAEEMLAQASTAPEYANYLVFIFSSSSLPAQIASNESLTTIRFSAAINLKNYIKKNYRSIPKPTLEYIKSSTLSTLQDPSGQIRGFAGTVITELILQGGLLQWPQLLQDLLSLLSNTNGNVSPEAQEGAMAALAKICEDNRRMLDKEIHGQRPLDVIIPQVLEYTGNPNPKIRVYALKTLKIFIAPKPRALIASLETYLNRLFQLANDQVTEVRRIICQSFVQLVDTMPELLRPHISGLVDYILYQQQNQDDPDLALDAAEFWLSIGEQEELRGDMGPYLGKVIPILLKGMIYGEEDVDRLGGQEDNADQEDKAEDLRPTFAKSKASRNAAKAGGLNENGSQGAANGAGGMDNNDLSEGEIEESDDDEGLGDPEDQWSLRKCSAAALDVFANVFHQPVFEVILPYLKENLGHQLWPKREAAVLALGAIADGCMEVVSPHLPELIPFLISCLNDQEPIVRQITCWCLGRYSEWASHLQDPAERVRYFEPMMEGLLHRMLDNNKKVQEAAASAFASLEEKSGNNLVPYTEPILRQFVQCFGRYKDNNMYILYDCVQTLAETVGGEMAKPHLVELLMPVLIGRWNQVSDQSREIFPLLECLGYVALAYGDFFSPFAQPIFDRCVKMIYENLQAFIAVANGQAIDEPDKDFLVTSLDLISTIVQAIEPSKSAHLAVSSRPPLFEMLAFCMEDRNNDVRQSSYALLGDCAINLYPQIQPWLSKIMPVLIRQVDLNIIRDEDSESGLNVLNNVCWSCGELGAKAGEAMSPYVEALYQGFVSILNNEEVPDSVNENAAMAIGRLGIGCAKELAPHLSQFAEPFLKSMVKIDHTQEKASAFLGFNMIIAQNPQAMDTALADYFTAVAMWPKRELSTEEYSDLKSSFDTVLQGYKQMIPDFAGFLAQISPNVVQKLRSMFSL